MSMKPSKKSDLNKDWMKNRTGREKKKLPNYHLIVTEGTDTEPFYFKEMQTIINSKSKDKIQLIISGKGDNTINLFEKAVQDVSTSSNGYRHVWIVYDTDDFPAEHIDAVPILCKKYSTLETTYHAVWSNQCFELWFLLHFNYLDTDIRREEYWPKLTAILNEKKLGKYDKSRTDMYKILKPYMDDAIKNAEKLAVVHKDKSPSIAAPSTKIYELVNKLKKYL